MEWPICAGNHEKIVSTQAWYFSGLNGERIEFLQGVKNLEMY